MTENLIYFYTKPRSQFGRPCKFSETKALLNTEIEPSDEFKEQFVPKNPCDVGTQKTPTFSSHEANTDPFDTCNKSVAHVEGGWPKDVNYQDIDQITRFRKKQEKDEQYTLTVNQLAQDVEHRVKQNNAINIYDSYFQKENKHLPGPPNISIKTTLKLSTHDCQFLGAASVNKISWSPFAMSKVVAAYAPTRFHNKNVAATNSFVWNLDNPSVPENTLTPMSSLTSVQYNPRDHFSIVGGCLSGQVVVWDVRKGQMPICECDPMHRHLDAVWETIWITSKASTELFTASTAGEIKWWDTRKMQEPYEVLYVDLTGENSQTKAEGVFCLAYHSTVPTRFLAGTELGHILLGNRKGKSYLEKVGTVYNGHIGPVHAVQRNPSNPKFFLSVGNSRARIWSEEIKDKEILATPLSEYTLMDGCWSPVRPSVLFLLNANGELEIWDFIYKQNVPVISMPVTRGYTLTSLLVHEEGEMLLCGDYTGTINLLSLSDGFFITEKEEKNALSSLLEMEKRREKIIEQRIKEFNAISSGPKPAHVNEDTKQHEEVKKEFREEKLEEGNPVENAERDFFSYINEYKAERENKRLDLEKQERATRDSSSETDSATSGSLDS